MSAPQSSALTTKLLVLVAVVLMAIGTGGCLAETDDQDYDDYEEDIGQVDEPFIEGNSRRVTLKNLRRAHQQPAEETAEAEDEETEPDPEPWIECNQAPQPGGGNNEENEGEQPAP
jgi:hypothetical protein